MTLCYVFGVRACRRDANAESTSPTIGGAESCRPVATPDKAAHCLAARAHHMNGTQEKPR